MATRRVILYIAVSIDGCIAKPDGDISWLSAVEQPGEDYGYANFIKTVDTVIMGRKTYDKVLTLVPEFPHHDKQCYIITRSSRPSQKNLEFYSGNVKNLIHQLKNEAGKNIFVDGGAEVVNLLLKENAIDEMILSVIPVILGSGIRLFQNGLPEQKFMLKQFSSFESGLVQLHYTTYQ